MTWFALEQTRFAYRADVAAYGTAVASLLGLVAVTTPSAHAGAVVAWVVAGWAGWSFVEYLLHRFVLHGLQPFLGWHEAHHARPTALLFTPTLLSAAGFATVVLAPAWLLFGPWQACALTLGVVAGYLAYSVTHHAVHHWRAESRWLKNRKRSHALHHQARGATGSYGVSSGFWDHVFASVSRRGGRPSRAS